MPAIPRIVLTPGDPAGIGPDLCAAVAQRDWGAELVAAADPDLLARRARRLGLPLRLEPLAPEAPAQPHRPGVLMVDPVHLAVPETCGRPDPRNADYVLATLRRAAQGCLDARYSAMVTGPIHKGTINEAGHVFSGHTEFLAEVAGSQQVVMLLMTDRLRVAVATTHLPLRAVSDAVTAPLLTAVLRVLHGGLQTWWGIARPRILVCGLNPHVGEGGHLGTEDRDVVIPVVETLRAEGLDLVGPLPADTLFIPKHLQGADAALAMYHDQGLPVLKYAGFGRAVNVTLGLPFLRTSVDHGTAVDLAGTGAADPGSLEAAIAAALDLGGRRPSIQAGTSP